jgi:hypothetical protein
MVQGGAALADIRQSMKPPVLALNQLHAPVSKTHRRHFRIVRLDKRY